MTESLPAHEGYIPFQGYRVWYRIVGNQDEPGKLPLLTLHGGPGATHDYLEPLEAAARRGRRVIFYDQLGNGKSDQPHDPSMWTVGLFLDELRTVRQELGLERVHILGQSWGGMLGMEYALTRPAGLAGLVVADSPASIPRWIEEANRLRSDLPPEVQATLRKHEEVGTTDHPEYEQATLVFYKRHLCRLDPWPDYLNRSFAAIAANPEVYHTMWGPSEFYATGTLRDWNIEDRLGEIQTPTLVLSGRYDEATPALVEVVHRGIPGSRWILFEHSSHTPHAEEPDRYLDVLDDFLTNVEARA